MSHGYLVSDLYLQQLIVVHIVGKKTVRLGQFPRPVPTLILSYIVILSFNIVLAIASLLLFVIM